MANWMTPVRAKARELGATVTTSAAGLWRRYNIEAPKGKVWACSDVHMLVVEWKHGDSQTDDWAASAIEDVLERMGHGLVDCDNPECDYCSEG